MPEFYRLLREADTVKLALDALGGEGCDEVIARCRILRTLERIQALKMI